MPRTRQHLRCLEVHAKLRAARQFSQRRAHSLRNQQEMSTTLTPAEDFTINVTKKFGTILVDPPWRFMNRTGKMAPEHRRLARYGTLSVEEIAAIPVQGARGERSHLYLWVPNALIAEGLAVMKAWGFSKSNIIWYKTRKDGGPDGRGVGFYFRNVTEILLFGIHGHSGHWLQGGGR